MDDARRVRTSLIITHARCTFISLSTALSTLLGDRASATDRPATTHYRGQPTQKATDNITFYYSRLRLFQHTASYGIATTAPNSSAVYSTAPGPLQASLPVTWVNSENRPPTNNQLARGRSKPISTSQAVLHEGQWMARLHLATTVVRHTFRERGFVISSQSKGHDAVPCCWCSVNLFMQPTTRTPVVGRR